MRCAATGTRGLAHGALALKPALARALAAGWLLSLPLAAQAYDFSRVVRTGITVPGIAVSFDDLDEPVLEGGFLAFCGVSYSAFGKNGIYRADLGSGAFDSIATDSTASPSGGGSFRDMCITGGLLPTIDDGDVAFTAYNLTTQGVYLWDGSLGTVVDEDSTFPGTTANPLRWDSPSLGGRIAVTWGNTPQTPNFAGIYSYDIVGLFAVTDTNSTPETAFFNVDQGTVSSAGVLLGEGAYVWHVNNSPSGPNFVYRRRFEPLGPVELIASEGQEIANGHFVDTPLFPQVDRSDPDQLCFMGGAPISGVYRFDGTELELVAGLDTPIPDGTGNFTGFGLWCAIDSGDVVFQATGSGGQNGVYIGNANGSIEKVVDTSDTLDGANPFQFATSREAISDGRIAFAARIGGDASIWVTPEPASAASGLVVLALLASAQRLRGAGRASASSRAISASTL